MDESTANPKGLTRESIRTAELISAVINVILTVLNVCLLLTCVSRRCRTISAAWYAYSLLMAVIFYGMILCIGLVFPTFYAKSGCFVLLSMRRMLEILLAIFVVWINIEVFRTIICPRLPWTENKVFRFYLQTFTALVLALLLVILVKYLLHLQPTICWGHDFTAEFVIHLFKSWILGPVVLFLGILNISGYVQLRSIGIENISPISNTTEWFVCVTLINGIFLFIECLSNYITLTHIPVIGKNTLAILLLKGLAHVIMGLPMLSLSSVRLTLELFVRRTLCRQAEEHSEEQADMNPSNIGNESL